MTRPGPGMLPAVTLAQPRCFAVTCGEYRVVNQHTHTGYRGVLLIHAGSAVRWDPAAAACPLVRAAWCRPPGCGGRLEPGNPGLPFQAVTAVAELAGCHHAADCARTSGEGGEVFCSPQAAPEGWHWQIAAIRPLPLPIPARGWRGLWMAPPGVSAGAAAQVRP